MTKTSGIFLCAWGKPGYAYAAFNFAASIKSNSPHVAVNLLCDQTVVNCYSDQNRCVFDSIEVMGEPVSDPGLFKAGIYDRLPFDYTLFMDVDALCIGDVGALLQRLISDYEKDGKFYRIHVHEWYDKNSPDHLPMMYWARRSVIWEKYGFTDQKFPATQSSIQFIAKCDKAKQFFESVYDTMKHNPIPLGELSHQWGGTQPDELYLNIQIAKDGIDADLNDVMWFCDNGTHRPHELKLKGYVFLSYFGVRARMKSYFIDYYDKSLVQMLRRMGFANHYWKSHAIFHDKHANKRIGTTIKRNLLSNPVRREPIVPVVRGTGKAPVLLSPNIKSPGWGAKAFEGGRPFGEMPMPEGKLKGKVNLYLTNLYETINDARKAELMECHRKNCENPLIDKIYNFGNLPYNHPKVINIPIEKRATYQDLIDKANSTDADYHIITNSDLYYDHTLNWLEHINMNQTMLALCRYDMVRGRAMFEAYSWSQGTWIFKGKINLTGMDYTIGLPGCENALALDAEKQGYQIQNPSVDIKAYHLHASGYRTYTQDDRIHGNGYKEVLICSISKLLKKRMLIIQPGAVGDILICLPIASWYADRGYIVDWLCPKQFHPMFNYVDYANPVLYQVLPYEKVIDLSFGINQKSDLHKDWMKRKPELDSFVTYKYELAGVPVNECRNLKYNRNEQREMELYNILGCDKNTPYSLVHLRSNYGNPADCDTVHPVVEFRPVGDYSVFDWRKVIEGATEIHCIDSSLCNFADSLPVVMGKLFYYKTDKVPMKADETILVKKWERINQMEYV